MSLDHLLQSIFIKTANKIGIWEQVGYNALMIMVLSDDIWCFKVIYDQLNVFIDNISVIIFFN